MGRPLTERLWHCTFHMDVATLPSQKIKHPACQPTSEYINHLAEEQRVYSAERLNGAALMWIQQLEPLHTLMNWELSATFANLSLCQRISQRLVSRDWIKRRQINFRGDAASRRDGPNFPSPLPLPPHVISSSHFPLFFFFGPQKTMLLAVILHSGLIFGGNRW